MRRSVAAGPVGARGAVRRRGALALRLGLVLSAGALLATAAASGVAAGSGRQGSTKPVKPDFSYFAGKTITLISPSAPGGSNDDLARIMAPLMASYLHCNINVEDNSAGADVAGQDAIAGAAPNGLTIGQMIPLSDIGNIVTNTGGVDFNLLKVPLIAGAAAGGGGMVIAQPNYPVKNLTQLIHSKTTVPMIEEGVSSTFIQVKTFLLAYHAKVSYLSGYNSGAAIAQGFVRGDAPMAIMGYSALEALILGGRARPIVIASELPKGTDGYDLMKKVPTFASYAASNPPKTASGKRAIKVALSIAAIPTDILFAPAGTPAPLVAALVAAARSAQAQASAQAAELNDGLKPGFIDPTASENFLKNAVQRESLLAQFLNG